MRNLLSANYVRLWKNRLFWLCIVAILIISIISILNGGRQADLLKGDGYPQTLDEYYFNLLPWMGLVFAVFDSLFLGNEYSDGTIRNKIVVGHKRKSVFLSNYIVCLTANLLFLMTMFIASFVGIPLLGFWRIGAEGLALYIFIAVLSTTALTGILILPCMLITNKAFSAVSSILVSFGLLLIASMIYNSLCETEFYGGVIITAQGITQPDTMPNPNYVSGFLRTVYQFIIDFLPTGVQIQEANVELNNPIISLLSSVVISIVTTITGILVFNKKDLK